MRRLNLIFVAALILLPTQLSYCSMEIQGNVVVSDRELLKQIDPNWVIKDISDRITGIYYNLGYFEIKVTEKSAKRIGDRIIVIDEGKSSRVSRIDLNLSPDSIKSLAGELPDQYSGRVASRATFTEFADRCINILAESGMPFARGEWFSFDKDENNDIVAEFRVIPGPRTIISAIEFDGIKRTRPRALEKAVDLKIGSLYSESKVSRAQKLLERLKYIEVSSPYNLETSPEGDSCTVIYNIRELPSTRIEGVGGFVNVQGKKDFIGKADIEFGDILGTGRRFGLLWNKKDTRSNELRMKYGEPFIFNSRLDLELEAYQIDRDTLYITTGAKLRIAHNLGIELSGALHFSVERTVPESGSTVSNSIKRSVGTEFLYIKTDFLPNPRSGYEIGSQLEYRYRSNRVVIAGQNPPTDITSAGANGAFYFNIFERFVMAAGLKAWGIVSANGSTPVDEYRFIGGVNDLRGYTEQQFPAYRYLIPTLEARLITGRYSRAYLFGDFGLIKGSPDKDAEYSFKPGYGFGLVSRSAIGQLRAEIGWGKRGFPSDAVFNFGIIGNF